MKRPRATRQGRLRGKVAVVISPADVAAVVVEAVVLPAGTTVEELVIAPTRGAL